jgi:hypothetical protein
MIEERSTSVILVTTLCLTIEGGRTEVRKSIIVGMVLTVLSISIFCSLNIMPVKANGTIYIRADGLIDPSSVQEEGD